MTNTLLLLSFLEYCSNVMKWHLCIFAKLIANQVMLNKIKKQPFPSQFGIENLINGCVPAINLLLALYRLCPLSKNDNITQTI